LDSYEVGAAVALILSAKSGSKSRNLSDAFRGGVGFSGFCRFLTVCILKSSIFAVTKKVTKQLLFRKECNELLVIRYLNLGVRLQLLVAAI
jgi:hypothetical protein